MANATKLPSAKWSMSLKVEWGLTKFSREKWYFNNDVSNKKSKYHQLLQQMKNNKNKLHNPCEGT
jgi:hypothetical protein